MSEIVQREHGNLLNRYESVRLEETKKKLEAQIKYSEHLWNCYDKEAL
jgi:hypothetical protein